MEDNQIEYVDQIDAEDRIIGTCTKEEAHRHGLLHRTVIAELHDEKGDWCLVKQAADRQDPGRYVSPVGGHVRAGESVEDALARETKEELGIVRFRASYVGKEIYNRAVIGRKENHLFIVYSLISTETPRINEESVDFRWFHEAELRQLLHDKPGLFGEAFHFVVRTFYPRLLRSTIT